MKAPDATGHVLITGFKVPQFEKVHNRRKTQHVPILLQWCHPSVRKTQVSGVTQNRDVTKISTAASKTRAAFRLASMKSVKPRRTWSRASKKWQREKQRAAGDGKLFQTLQSIRKKCWRISPCSVPVQNSCRGGCCGHFG